MTGLHNTQRARAQKVWPDCKFCDGTGLTTRSFHRGFFSYNAGVTCPECHSKHQDEIQRDQERRAGTMNFTTTYVRPEDVQAYPPPHADEVRIMARLNAMDAKLDAILKKLGAA